MTRLARVPHGGRGSIGPYGPNSFWNRPLNYANGTDILQGAGSGAAIANQINYGRQATDQCAGQGSYTFQGYSGIGYGSYNRNYAVGFNYSSYSQPIYVVDSTRDALVKVGIINHSSPPTVKNPSGLQTYCNTVPFPDISQCPKLAPNMNAAAGTAFSNLASDGTDKTMILYEPKKNRMWEFWVMEGGNNPWAAAQALFTPAADWTTGNAGYLGPELGAGNTPADFSGVFTYDHSWGIRAVGCGVLGGLITLQDLRDVHAGGTINHAITIAQPLTTGGYFPPAVRADGNSTGNPVSTIPSGYPSAGTANPAYGKDQISEGHRFAFPPTVDLSTCTYPLARALTEAIRDYGMYVMDTSGYVAFYIEDPRTLGSIYHLQGPDAPDPFTLDWASIQPDGGSDPRWDKNGNPIFWQMPWDDLQLLNTVNN